MPKGKQAWRRVHRRVEVRYGPDRARYVGYSRNVSRTGIMVGAFRVFAPGTLLHLELTFPSATFRLRGQVVWARAGGVEWVPTGRVGMGIAFLDPSDDFLSAIREFSQAG